MSNPQLEIPPEFDTASREERIAYAQALWDRIAEDPENVPVPDHHKRILRERLDEYRANTERGRPYYEVRNELLTKLHNS